MGSAISDVHSLQVTKPAAGEPLDLEKTNDRSAVNNKGKNTAESDKSAAATSSKPTVGPEEIKQDSLTALEQL